MSILLTYLPIAIELNTTGAPVCRREQTGDFFSRRSLEKGRKKERKEMNAKPFCSLKGYFRYQSLSSLSRFARFVSRHP